MEKIELPGRVPEAFKLLAELIEDLAARIEALEAAKVVTPPVSRKPPIAMQSKKTDLLENK